MSQWHFLNEALAPSFRFGTSKPTIFAADNSLSSVWCVISWIVWVLLFEKPMSCRFDFPSLSICFFGLKTVKRTTFIFFECVSDFNHRDSFITVLSWSYIWIVLCTTLFILKRKKLKFNHAKLEMNLQLISMFHMIISTRYGTTLGTTNKTWFFTKHHFSNIVLP